MNYHWSSLLEKPAEEAASYIKMMYENGSAVPIPQAEFDVLFTLACKVIERTEDSLEGRVLGFGNSDGFSRDGRYSICPDPVGLMTIKDVFVHDRAPVALSVWESDFRIETSNNERLVAYGERSTMQYRIVSVDDSTSTVLLPDEQIQLLAIDDQVGRTMCLRTDGVLVCRDIKTEREIFSQSMPTARRNLPSRGCMPIVVPPLMKVNHGGTHLLTSLASSAELTLISVNNFNTTAKLELNDSSYINHALFSNDDSKVVCIVNALHNHDSKLVLLDAMKLEILAEARLPLPVPLEPKCRISPGDSSLLIQTDIQHFVLVDLTSFELLSHFSGYDFAFGISDTIHAIVRNERDDWHLRRLRQSDTCPSLEQTILQLMATPFKDWTDEQRKMLMDLPVAGWYPLQILARARFLKKLFMVVHKASVMSDSSAFGSNATAGGNSMLHSSTAQIVEMFRKEDSFIGAFDVRRLLEATGGVRELSLVQQDAQLEVYGENLWIKNVWCTDSRVCVLLDNGLCFSLCGSDLALLNELKIPREFVFANQFGEVLSILTGNEGDSAAVSQIRDVYSGELTIELRQEPLLGRSFWKRGVQRFMDSGYKEFLHIDHSGEALVYNVSKDCLQSWQLEDESSGKVSTLLWSYPCERVYSGRMLGPVTVVCTTGHELLFLCNRTQKVLARYRHQAYCRKYFHAGSFLYSSESNTDVYCLRTLKLLYRYEDMQVLCMDADILAAVTGRWGDRCLKIFQLNDDGSLSEIASASVEDVHQLSGCDLSSSSFVPNVGLVVGCVRGIVLWRRGTGKTKVDWIPRLKRQLLTPVNRTLPEDFPTNWLTPQERAWITLLGSLQAQANVRGEKEQRGCPVCRSAVQDKHHCSFCRTNVSHLTRKWNETLMMLSERRPV